MNLRLGDIDSATFVTVWHYALFRVQTEEVFPFLCLIEGVEPSTDSLKENCSAIELYQNLERSASSVVSESFGIRNATLRSCVRLATYFTVFCDLERLIRFDRPDHSHCNSALACNGSN